MTTRYLRPRLLRPDDLVDDFECRSAEQTLWLRHHARQADTAGTAKVLVVTEADSPIVVAYYAWAMASINLAGASARLRKGAGRCPQPVALLARLGVDIAYEDVIRRVIELGAHIGCRGLLVHAASEESRNFCLHLVPGFEPSPTDPLHLMFLMKDLLHTLRNRS